MHALDLAMTVIIFSHSSECSWDVHTIFDPSFTLQNLLPFIISKMCLNFIREFIDHPLSHIEFKFVTLPKQVSWCALFDVADAFEGV